MVTAYQVRLKLIRLKGLEEYKYRALVEMPDFYTENGFKNYAFTRLSSAYPAE